MYGLAIAYRYTNNKEYLDLSVKLTEKFIDNCTEDGVPVWDFRLPEETPSKKCGIMKAEWDETDIKNIDFAKDTSAAAVALCTINELNKYTSSKKFDDYYLKTMQSLCDKYVDPDKNKTGILTNSNGQMAFASYGDFYFMEAIAGSEYGIDVCW